MRSLVSIGVFFLLSCSSPTASSTPNITILINPTTLTNDGTKALVRAVATAADGTIGKGTVAFSSTMGSVTPASVPIDQYGTAEANFSCNTATDPLCVAGATVTVKATWDKGPTDPAQGTVSIHAATSGTGGGGGSSGGGVCACTGSAIVLPKPSVTMNAPVSIGNLAAGTYCWYWTGGAFQYAADPCWVVSAAAPSYEILNATNGTIVSYMVGSTGCPATQAAAEAAFVKTGVKFGWTGGELKLVLDDPNYLGNAEGSPSPSFTLCAVQ